MRVSIRTFFLLLLSLYEMLFLHSVFLLLLLLLYVYIFIHIFPLCESRSFSLRIAYIIISYFFSVFLFWLSGWIRIQMYMRMYNSVVYLCTTAKIQ